MAEVHVVDNFENCFDRFTIGHGSYLVVMTRGHLYDRLILEQALKTDATYIGMIGSKSKKKIIYDYLLTQGVTQERLDQVYAPIGLSIGAQTPAEIAVSIVAELIQARFLSV
jgi:xanthine dehydrogenase accessory factor